MLRATLPHIPACVLLVPLILLVLAGCADAGTVLTYGERMATAAAQGCWEGAEHTPLPVTVTLPPSQGTSTAIVVRNPGDPTLTPTLSPTARPTTTPLPHCTPRPGTTEEPWPTPYPTEPALPTREADRRHPVVDAETVVLQLPNNSLVIMVDPMSSTIFGPVFRMGASITLLKPLTLGQGAGGGGGAP
ncbi:MAG: hypothetical protein HGA45_38445, partial [Chloroflexales bacterium]|nr:hypothetical protein [Chloroflexales bacterium]